MTGSGGLEHLSDNETPSQTAEGEPAALPTRVAVYVTPISTLVLLSILTVGLYPIYWFYRHWSVQKRARRLPIWPAARGLFSIFFVHRLFLTIDRAARASGTSPRWNPDSQATTYVGLVIASRLIGRIGSDQFTVLFVEIALVLASLLPLATAQQLANLANGRRELAEDEDEDDEDRIEAAKGDDDRSDRAEDEEDEEDEDRRPGRAK